MLIYFGTDTQYANQNANSHSVSDFYTSKIKRSQTCEMAQKYVKMSSASKIPTVHGMQESCRRKKTTQQDSSSSFFSFFVFLILFVLFCFLRPVHHTNTVAVAFSSSFFFSFLRPINHSKTVVVACLLLFLRPVNHSKTVGFF